MLFGSLGPAFLSLLILSAHLLRLGSPFLLGAVALLVIVWVPRPWARRTVRTALIVGALEWVRTLVVLTNDRFALGQPYLRMDLILAGVGVFTAASALLMGSDAAERFYRITARPASAPAPPAMSEPQPARALDSLPRRWL